MVRTKLGKKRGQVSISILLAMTLIGSGCSSTNTPTTGGTTNDPPAPSTNTEQKPDVTEPEQPFKITMSLNFDGKDIPKPDNPVQKAIEEYTNTSLELQYTPGAQYQDKLSVLIASGDMPMVVASYGAPKQSYLLSAFKNDVFWDISPYIQEFPNLSKLNDTIFENVAYDGKVYGLPRERPIARNAFIYRADWLAKVGLEEPKTLEEFYTMLKAFKEQDPDGNGKDDTYGMSMGAIGGSGPEPQAYAVFMGAPNVWSVEDGSFVRDVFKPEYLEGLKFQKRLYDEQLIHPDFSIMDRPQMEGEFENSKAGVIYNTTNVALSYEARVMATVPDAKVSFFSILGTDKGEFVAGAMGSNGILMFPKTSVKTEDDLKRILTYFDQLADQEMADLLSWGIEGEHSKIVDGKYEMVDQEAFDNEVGFPYKWPMRAVDLEPIKTEGNVNPLLLKELEVTENNKNYVVNNPANPLISDTFTERGVELEQIIKDADVKFVMGRIDEAQWKKEMDKWWSSGGETIAKEYEAALAGG
ncbi:extracellular solute-binding protein [Paenibacillus daejeonensis]|uniref:extracellular solute-binding protein n=1 Tax=Paenibacillus daejeonensis TaxID=135193 RepID=UPI00036CBE21|nr:extracellular solute-binding protein [Paenibacillus daejeonensis]